ncbi:MAG: hypothetical protein AB8G22_10980, partial [Saprospiraceae bacterium]
YNMKDSSDIHGLNELRKQRRKLELQMQVTQREFAHSMGLMNSNMQEVLLKRVVLPVSALGIGYFLLKKVTRRKSKPTVRIEKEQIKDLKKTVAKAKAETPTPRSTTTQPVNSFKSSKPTYTPPQKVVKQTVVKKPRDLQLKKWLPVAIQLAKTGFTYYQNNIADSNITPTTSRQTNVARNFLTPKKQPKHGGVYDHVPDVIE